MKPSSVGPLGLDCLISARTSSYGIPVTCGADHISATLLVLLRVAEDTRVESRERTGCPWTVRRTQPGTSIGKSDARACGSTSCTANGGSDFLSKPKPNLPIPKVQTINGSASAKIPSAIEITDRSAAAAAAGGGSAVVVTAAPADSSNRNPVITPQSVKIYPRYSGACLIQE